MRWFSTQHFDPKLPQSRSHTKAEGFRLSCARFTGVNCYEFFTVGSILGLNPTKIEQSWLQANGGSRWVVENCPPASWTMKNLPRMTEVSSPKVSTLAFLLVLFFSEETSWKDRPPMVKLIILRIEFSQNQGTNSGGGGPMINAPFLALQTFWK